jgi:hypothetical protein
MVIIRYSIGAYWCVFYWWLLVTIIDYFISRSWSLLIAILLMDIGNYSNGGY